MEEDFKRLPFNIKNRDGWTHFFPISSTTIININSNIKYKHRYKLVKWLTLISFSAEALVLVLSIGHTGATVQTRPAVTWAAIITLTDGSAFSEAVWYIQLLSIDEDLFKKKKKKPKWNCLISKPKMNITYREGHSHLSYASIKQHANIGRFGQDVHAGHSSQIHGCVDVKALGLARRRSCNFSCMVHLQGAVLINPLRHHAMPLTQRHGLLTAQNSLTCERGGKIWFSLDRIGTSHYM